MSNSWTTVSSSKRRNNKSKATGSTPVNTTQSSIDERNDLSKQGGQKREDYIEKNRERGQFKSFNNKIVNKTTRPLENSIQSHNQYQNPRNSNKNNSRYFDTNNDGSRSNNINTDSFRSSKINKQKSIDLNGKNTEIEQCTLLNSSIVDLNTSKNPWFRKSRELTGSNNTEIEVNTNAPGIHIKKESRSNTPQTQINDRKAIELNFTKKDIKSCKIVKNNDLGPKMCKDPLVPQVRILQKSTVANKIENKEIDNKIQKLPKPEIPYTTKTATEQNIPEHETTDSNLKNRKVIHYSLAKDSIVEPNTSNNAWVPPSRVSKKSTNNKGVEIEDIQKKVKSILNKITPDTKVILTKSIMDLQINTYNCLNKIIELLFEKAIDEPSFTPLYAYICSQMKDIEVASEEDNTKITFNKLILQKCQKTFRLVTTQEINAEDCLREIESCNDLALKEELLSKYEENERIQRKRAVGNCRFICEMFKVKLLNSTILDKCVSNLLKCPKEEPLECLCNILKHVGKKLNPGNTYEKLREYSSVDYRPKIPSRIRFMILDTIDLKNNNWVPRNTANEPKTINEINVEFALTSTSNQTNFKSTVPIKRPHQSKINKQKSIDLNGKNTEIEQCTLLNSSIVDLNTSKNPWFRKSRELTGSNNTEIEVNTNAPGIHIKKESRSNTPQTQINDRKAIELNFTKKDIKSCKIVKNNDLGPKMCKDPLVPQVRILQKSTVANKIENKEIDNKIQKLPKPEIPYTTKTATEQVVVQRERGVICPAPSDLVQRQPVAECHLTDDVEQKVKEINSKKMEIKQRKLVKNGEVGLVMSKNPWLPQYCNSQTSTGAEIKESYKKDQNVTKLILTTKNLIEIEQAVKPRELGNKRPTSTEFVQREPVVKNHLSDDVVVVEDIVPTMTNETLPHVLTSFRAIGVEGVGGLMVEVVSKDTTLPVTRSIEFLVKDLDRPIVIYTGDSVRMEENTVLGELSLQRPIRYDAGRRAEVHVIVTVHVDADGYTTAGCECRAIMLLKKMPRKSGTFRGRVDYVPSKTDYHCSYHTIPAGWSDEIGRTTVVSESGSSSSAVADAGPSDSFTTPNGSDLENEEQCLTSFIVPGECSIMDGDDTKALGDFIKLPHCNDPVFEPHFQKDSAVFEDGGSFVVDVTFPKSSVPPNVCFIDNSSPARELISETGDDRPSLVEEMDVHDDSVEVRHEIISVAGELASNVFDVGLDVPTGVHTENADVFGDDGAIAYAGIVAEPSAVEEDADTSGTTTWMQDVRDKINHWTHTLISNPSVQLFVIGNVVALGIGVFKFYK